MKLNEDNLQHMLHLIGNKGMCTIVIKCGRCPYRRYMMRTESQCSCTYEGALKYAEGYVKKRMKLVPAHILVKALA